MPATIVLCLCLHDHTN